MNRENLRMEIKDIWSHRYFILSTIKTEFRLRFIRSRLGGFWMILNPLAQVLMFTFVLSAVLSAKLPGMSNRFAYGIYLMSGMLGWTLFSEILNRCLTLFIDYAGILKKLFFPKIALLFIVSGGALINHLLLLAAILIIFSLLGHLPGLTLFWLPILCVLNMLFALALGLILGIINVFIRDISQIVPIVLQFLFWLTPVVYMINILPAHYQHWLVFNPLASIITAYQDVLMYNCSPSKVHLAIFLLLDIVLFLFALYLFHKASPEIVDQL